MERDLAPPPYRDVPLFLTLILFINVITYYLTYSHINWGWFLLATFLIDLSQGYLAWWAMRSIIVYLDRRLPYEGHFARRLAVQLPATGAACVLVLAGLTELVNALASDKPVPPEFYRHHVFIFLIWALLINCIYVGLHYYQRYRQAETLRHAAEQAAALAAAEAARQAAEAPTAEAALAAPGLPAGLQVPQGRRVVEVPFDDIAAFYVEDEATMLHTAAGSRYVLSYSLDRLEAELPAGLFYRVNRQYLLHRRVLAGYDRLDNGKLAVRLRPLTPLPAEVSVSRLKAPTFKKWFAGEPAGVV